jgi:exodeoxyribonuclease V alpha subunit
MPETLEGIAERITYYSDETGYTVLRLHPQGRVSPMARSRDGLVTVVGNLPEINPGEALRLHGDWTAHPQHGLQFRAEQCERVRPATVEGIRRYLGSGLIKGVGPVTAGRIVETFGKDTLDVIEYTPHRLEEVPGVGRKRTRFIREAWNEQRHIQEVMLFLQSQGVSTTLAVKIHKTYGDKAIAIVQQNPYRLARDIRGIGFRTADKIAQQLGLALDSPARVEAGVLFALDEATGEGHVFVPRTDLVREAAELLGVAPEAVADAMDSLLLSETILAGYMPEDQAIYLAPLYYAELGVARRMARLLTSPASRLRTLHYAELTQSLAEAAAHLSGQQAEALQSAISNKVTILTGGPGTGKTTALRALVETLAALGYKVALASPTGRAARRLSEATGHPAQTVHRLLGYSPSGDFGHDEQNPLDGDVLIVDEASMLDLVLTNHLLKALDPATHLLLVGDADQLPSVGAGDVLRDLITSETISTMHLTTIFRQDAGSLIVHNAHRVNSGRMPLTPKDALDFFLFPQSDPEQAADLLVDIVQNRIPGKFGLDPVDDVQVLAPMYRGVAGVSRLNALLQAALNPGSPGQPERRLAGQLYRLGDKVMQLRNNYEKEVFNGDIGRIAGIDATMHQLVVRFDDNREIVYDWSDADELALAWAISVHKSQGSEFPCVVIPVLTQHYMMLQRNLLYTAITRARRLVVLVGEQRAIAIAVRNNEVARRHSRLAERLREEIEAAGSASDVG